MADAACHQPFIHPILHRPRTETGKRHRPIPRQRFNPRQPLRLVAQFDEQRSQARAIGFCKVQVPRIIGKGPDMHRGERFQLVQNMERPDFVATVRRPRNAVGEE